ncbi:hypothetical protein MHM98_07490 [Psychrobium sp. MM17-31]|uniref:hypothetical protein n=1 Tax=Psychrobium sp. MM17-31 TaxID=2917758 RepID=UPI001EF62476|nr:hypothetical protein [Psychrobium sp. MM17-31]MCG7531195.1 hypothetical protein [Psychrobium sp. MM17-31]
MTKQNINTLVMATVFAASLAIPTHCEADTKHNINNSIVQQKLTQEITKQSDKRLNQFMTSMTTQLDEQLTQLISAKLRL